MQASPEALGRIAQALSLSRAEHDYLFKLAGRVDPEGSRGPSADAPPSLIAAVKAIEYPAYGLDRLWNACCWNEAAARLFRGWLDGDCQRNLLRYVFLEPSARELIPAWKDRARRLLAEFRADFARTFRDAQVKIFVETLRGESAFFAEAWDEQAVQIREGGLRLFNHPHDGLVSFIQHTFAPAERPDYKLVINTPVEQMKLRVQRDADGFSLSEFVSGFANNGVESTLGMAVNSDGNAHRAMTTVRWVASIMCSKTFRHGRRSPPPSAHAPRSSVFRPRYAFSERIGLWQHWV